MFVAIEVICHSSGFFCVVSPLQTRFLLHLENTYFSFGGNFSLKLHGQLAVGLSAQLDVTRHPCDIFLCLILA